MDENRVLQWYIKGVEINARWLVIVWHSDLSYSQIYLDDTMPMVIDIPRDRFISINFRFETCPQVQPVISPNDFTGCVFLKLQS